MFEIKICAGALKRKIAKIYLENLKTKICFFYPNTRVEIIEAKYFLESVFTFSVYNSTREDVLFSIAETIKKELEEMKKYI